MYADKHQSLYKLALSFFMEVGRHVQNIQKKLIIFLQFIKKKEETAFVFYCDVKHLHILRGSSHVCCYLFLSVTIFSIITTLFDVVSCIFKLKDFNWPNSLMSRPIIKLVQ